MWTHHGAAFPLAPVFDARAIIYVQRGNLHEALRIVLADPDRDVDRILDAGPLLIEDLERLVQHWTETTQGLTPGESSA